MQTYIVLNLALNLVFKFNLSMLMATIPFRSNFLEFVHVVCVSSQTILNLLARIKHFSTQVFK